MNDRQSKITLPRIAHSPIEEEDENSSLSESYNNSNNFRKFSNFSGLATARKFRRRSSVEDYHKSREILILNAKKRREELMHKWRKVSHWIIILFTLWRVHARKVKEFMDSSMELLDAKIDADLLFDVTEFKCHKQARVPKEAKRILQKRQNERTDDEMHYVQIALRNYKAIADYPPNMQRVMAKKGWYEVYEGKRVIVRQGHPARCYYFILSGSVIVSKLDPETGLSRTLTLLHSGESFGEIGIIHAGARTASVVSKDTVELLAFIDDDYVDIFMSGGLKDPGDPFLKTVPCLRGWPLHLLNDNSEKCFQTFYKKGAVLTKNSTESEWIYIVKSVNIFILYGRLAILKRLNEVPPESLEDAPVTTQKSCKQLLLNVDAHENYLLKKIQNQNDKLLKTNGGKFKGLPEIRVETNGIFYKNNLFDNRPKGSPSKSKRMPKLSKSHLMRLAQEIPQSIPETDENEESYVKYQEELTKPIEEVGPIFVIVQILTKGSVFGLADIICGDQTNFSVVSKGAECIVVNKKFYMENITESLQRFLRRQVFPYPTESKMQDDLSLHLKWEIRRKKILENTIRRIKGRRVDVHNARSRLLLKSNDK
ncbi:DgyrCDS4171 [Dimorphilus gyrociliatus]|uniref:DgyrCDS4171 n=1 Tax=Dimorphilus gyrociliatus TaxID=2664684 RepID=A0A7I8VIA5_9ANNE|nr:DgyrCDS4171 [Dimorphilus gyrociliatus]